MEPSFYKGFELLNSIEAMVGFNAIIRSNAKSEGGIRERFGNFDLPFYGNDLVGEMHHHGVFYACPTYEDSACGLVIDGWVAKDDGSGALQLEECAGLYSKYGIGFVEKLNGAFNILLWDKIKGRTYFVNDRYAQRPMYGCGFEGSMAFSYSAQVVLDLAGRRSELNEQAFYNMLSYSRVWAGTATLYQEVEVIPPATIIEFTGSSFVRRQYWDYEFNTVDRVDDDFIDNAVDVFRCAVKRHLSPWDSLSVNLSGGLDSRAVLAAINPTVRERTTAYTWGYAEDCYEVDLSKKTAEVLGVNWKFLKLRPDDFISRAAEGVRILEGADLCVQSYGLFVYPQISKVCEMGTTGLAMDVLCGGSYSSDFANYTGDATAEAFHQLLGKIFSFKGHAESMFLDQDVALKYQRANVSQLTEDVNFSGDLSIANAMDRFALRQRCSRVIFPRQNWQRRCMDDVVPTFDNDFIDCLLTLPAEERANHKFYRRFLQKLDPEMMEIPYQRTLLPPSAPVAYWKEAARLESEKEQLLRRIYAETGGAVYIPYNRYYSNFDEWLRVNSSWRLMCDELLLSKECRLTDRFLSRNWVHQIVKEQRSAVRAHYSVIVQLLTAELVLRELF